MSSDARTINSETRQDNFLEEGAYLTFALANQDYGISI
jgi:hypothetical protein